MRLSIALFLFLAPIVAVTETISVGATSLDIPDPRGFAPVTPQMGVLFDVEQRFVTAEYELLFAYTPIVKAEHEIEDEIPGLTRKFNVQTVKSLVDKSLSSKNFAQLKQTVKTQNEAIINAEKGIPEMIGQANKVIREDYSVKSGLSVSLVVPMPPHYETNRILAYSVYMRLNLNDEYGNPTTRVLAATTTMVHTKGKILLLYSYAGEKDLEWSRQMSKEWANAIVKENPHRIQPATS